jgi:hypothetical protein
LCHSSYALFTLKLGCFQWFAPKLYEDYVNTLSTFFSFHPDFKPNFTNSIFTAATFNLGPNTVCIDHVDCHNKWNGWCAITAGGTYNPLFGGHLVLWDLKKIIEFPPGSTILLPSATLRHSNLPIQPHETRVSFTQYVAGGIFRWVEYGFKTGVTLKAVDKLEMMRLDDEQGLRWKQGLEKFSKLEELHSDHMHLWGSSQHLQ